MRILITGVNGFIGRHMAKFLSARHEVVGVARASSSVNNSLAINLVSADLSEPGFVKRLPSGIDCIIHLAQSTQYRNFPGGVEDMRRVNIDATCELLEWARITEVKQFIFSSTANVYGKSNEQLTESHVTQPDSFYGATKLAAEHLAKQYQPYFQVDVLRLFTVYGPGQTGMLIPNIADRIRQGQPITLAKGVGLYLTPVYVGDVVLVINKLLNNFRGGYFRVFNVCGTEVVGLDEIVKAIEAVVSFKACIKLTDEEVQLFSGSNSRLKQYIEYMEFKNIGAGLKVSFNGQDAESS